MVEIKYNTNCNAGPNAESRIRNRLKDSGAGTPGATTVKTGDGPQRVFHHVHERGYVKVRGKGEMEKR